jgi:glucoamylase
VTRGVDDPGRRPHANGRRLEFLPAAVLGNGALLVTLSARGEVERLFWPHVDRPDNLGELRLAIRSEAGDAWLDEGAAWRQEWISDVSVLRTTV